MLWKEAAFTETVREHRNPFISTIYIRQHGENLGNSLSEGFVGESRAGILQAKQQQADSKTSPSPNCRQQKFERKFLVELCCIFVETTLSLDSFSLLTQGRR